MKIFGITTFLAFAIDQLSKYLVLMSGQEAVVINKGASFGMRVFSGQEGLVGLLYVLLLFWQIKTHAFHNKLEKISWGLLLGGGLSNTLDRIFRGGVIDWWRWEIFGFTNNLADIMIFVAVIGIFSSIIVRRLKYVKQKN